MAKQETELQKIANVIHRKLAFTNGWKIDSDSYEAICFDTAKKIIKYLKRKKDIKQATETKTTVPHRCPICGGHGQVPGSFYTSLLGCGGTSANLAEQCKSCQGTGVIFTEQITTTKPI
jgi:hypothetical protein